MNSGYWFLALLVLGIIWAILDLKRKSNWYVIKKSSHQTIDYEDFIIWVEHETENRRTPLIVNKKVFDRYDLLDYFYEKVE